MSGPRPVGRPRRAPGPPPATTKGPRSSVEDVSGWLSWMRAAGTPSTTVNLRRYYVQRLAVDHPQRRLRDLTIEELLAWLAATGWSANTRKSARSSLRSFYGWLRDTGRVEHSIAHDIPVVRVPRSRPKPTPEAVFRHALEEADDRVALAIRLAGQCGLRRGEMARAAREDAEETAPGFYSLRVVGKGGHVRMVPLPPELATLILARPAGYLFPAPHGGHLSPHHLAKLIARTLGGGASTHSLRHRCASVAYAGTRDLRAVQELLGHTRPETTAGYVLAPDDTIRAAMSAAAL